MARSAPLAIAIFLLSWAALSIAQDDGVPPAPPAPESVPFGSVTDSMLDMLTAAQAKGGDEDPNVIAVSEMDDSIDGWVLDGAGGSGLRTDGTAALAEDSGSGVWFFSAPKKFLGDIRQAYGGRLEYSLGFYHSDSLGKSPPAGDDIVLHSQAHGTTIVRRGVIKPWVYASNVDVELTASAEWVDGVTGEPCGEDSLRMVLSSLSSLKIRGGYYAGRETTWVKGITLRRSAISTQEQPPDLAPSLSYSTSDPDTRPIPPKARRVVAPPSADGSSNAGSSPAGHVSKELYSHAQEMNAELEKENDQLRSRIAELQGRLSASTDESSRLRGALVECKDGSRRNADLADATARNLKQAENEKVEVESERDAAVRRLSVCDDVRRQKQARVEELLRLSGGAERAEEALQELNEARISNARCMAATDRLETNATAMTRAARDAEKGAEVLRGKLALCEGAKNATSEAVTRLEELVASPLARMAERLENRDEGSVDREARLASVCATRGTRMLSAAVVMVMLPYGVAAIGLPFASRISRGGIAPLNRIASIGDLAVILLWTATAAHASFSSELQGLITTYDIRTSLFGRELTEDDLHWGGGVMYGGVVGLHLLALFSAPDVYSTIQAFAFWGIGLHYYADLDQTGAAVMRGAKDRAASGAPQGVYIVALLLLAALSAAGGGGQGASGGRRGGRGRKRRGAGGIAGVDSDVGLSEIDEYGSDSDEEEEDGEDEQLLEFPADPGRDRVEKLQAFEKGFFAKYPPEKASQKVKSSDGKTERFVSRQFLKDVATMVRLDGRKVQGKDDAEKALAAYAAIEKGVGKGGDAASVMGMANQNLGTYLYQMLVERYAEEDAKIKVVQAGHHFIDVATQGGLVVALSAYFRLRGEGDAWLVRAEIRIEVSKGRVLTTCSKPVRGEGDAAGIDQDRAR